MNFVLSGEGPTDIGKIDYVTRLFDPGPMTYFIDAVVHEKTGVSPLKTHSADGDVIFCIHKKELSDKKIGSPMVLSGKKSAQGTAYFIKNAYVLGHIAQHVAQATGLTTIAVLFRDADPTRSHDDYEDKWTSMMNGFKRAGFDHGVPMIPRQIMEAWLLDALDWKGKSHPDFETVTGGRRSTFPYKEKLAEILEEATTQNNLVNRICDGTLDQRRITVHSYQRFKARLEEVLDTHLQ